MFSRKILRLATCDAAAVKIGLPIPNTPKLLAPYEIVLFAREAKIIDETDGRRLWKKFFETTRSGISGVVVDAMDDEPYISSQLAPSIWKAEELADGISLVCRAVGLSDKHPVVIETYKNIFDTEIKIPSHIGRYKVKRVGGAYPAENRAERLNKRESTLVVGAGAVLALRNAVYLGIGHTTCYITIAGDCISNPANYEIPIGTTVSFAMESAGLIAQPKRVIVGGSMTGFGITDPDVAVITPTTRGILAFAHEYRDFGFTCIACGRCTDVCPEKLSPYHIYKLIEHNRTIELKRFDIHRCNGCGACSYICPAKLNLSQTIYQHSAYRQKKGGLL
jgi:electron transport complex protein RnfC